LGQGERGRVRRGMDDVNQNVKSDLSQPLDMP